MSKEAKKLIVEDLPNNITEDNLRIVLGNKRRAGGGPIENVELRKDGDTCCAIITFNESDAVDLILSRGDTVVINDVEAKVKRFDSCESKSKTKAHKKHSRASTLTSSDDTSESESESNLKAGTHAKKKLLTKTDDSKMKKTGFKTNILDSDDEEINSNSDDSSDSDTLLDKQRKGHKKDTSKAASKKKKVQEESKVQKSAKKATKKKLSTASDSNDDTDEADSQQLWERTIKAKVINVTRSKDFYQLYFEDSHIFQGSFDENSLMLDGLNKHIYVTFDSRKAALATCRFNHKPDSNLSKVEMATEEDFNTYGNLLSVHGEYPISTAQEKKELKEKIRNSARMEVLDVLQYDEPRSAIIMFDPDSCGDISAATWISVECGGTRLIVAPVFKTKCVKVTGLNPLSVDSTICRYFSNEKRSGGGEVATVSRPNKGECIVTFKAENSVDGVIKKGGHVLEGSDLKVSLYHSCLSKDVYKQQIMKSDRKHCTETSCYKQPQSQTPLKHRQTSHPELKCVVVPLCSSSKLDHNNKKFQYTLELCKCGFQFLKSREQILSEMMHSVNCKHTLTLHESQGVMTIHLDYQSKVTAQVVKEMLKIGTNKVLNYMHNFRTAQFIIDKSEIYGFQKFYLKYRQELPDELYFDHQDNVAVFISDRDENWMKGMVNSFYHKFLSDGDGLLGASGYSDEEMSSIKDDDIESDNACQQKSRGPNNGRPYSVAQRRKAPPTLAPKPNLTNRHHSKKEEEENDKHWAFVDEETLEEKDAILFQFTNFLKDIEKEHQPLKIIIDPEKHVAVIKSHDPSEIAHVKLKLFKKARDFRSRNIESIFSQQQKELLMKQNVQDKINKELKEKNFLAQVKCTSDAVTLYHDKGVTDDVLKKIVESYVVVTERSLDPDMVLTFQSEKGRKFLSELCESSDGVKVCSFAELKDNTLLIITSSQQLDLLMNDVNRFVEENKRYEKRVPFSYGKQKYVQKYLKDGFQRIKNSLKDHGATITENKEDIAVHGLKDGVNLGEQKLHEMSERIVVEDALLDFFGIKEFLQATEGKALLKNVENSKKCIILPKSNSQQGEGGSKSSPGRPVPLAKPVRIIARAKVDDCTFEFLQGDITGLDAEAIINPIESSLKCQTGLGKALLLKAGQVIETELSSFGTRGSPGTVVQTSAGHLNNCQAIMHVICPVFYSSERDILERAITACLNKITSQGFMTVATPALGTGKIFKFPPMVACDGMMTSLHQVLTAGRATLRKIYLCDVKVELVKELIERFKNVFQQEVEEVGDFRESPFKAAPTPAPKPSVAKAAKALKDFRNIKVNLIHGEISKEKSDVIVVSASKNLDLSKGRITKTILKYGGEALQEELKSNYSDGINPGEFAKSSGGNLKCGSIFYACLHHWKQNNESHLSKLVYKLLEGADAQKATSISIPAIGTGNLGYPADVAADVITDTISQFAKNNQNSSLKIVNLVVFPRDTEIVQAFQAALSGDRTKMDSSGAERDWRHDRSGGKNEVQFGSVKLSIKKGDIVLEKCDAILSGVRDTMDLSNSGAVCKALLSKCGSALQDECNNKKDEMAQNGFTATSAPNLNCKQIYHVSMDKFAHSWNKCISQVLKDAEKQGLTSVALPALGTGAKRADNQHIKKTIFGGVEYFSKHSEGKLKDVRLVVFSQNLLEEFTGVGATYRHSPRDKEDDSQSHGVVHVSSKAEFKIYADDFSKIVSAKKELQEVFGKAFKEESEKQKEVKRMNPHQVKQLEDEGKRHCVLVSVDVEGGLIIMKGFKADDFLHVQKMLRKLLIEAVDNHHRSLHKAVVSAIRWQYEQGGNWRDFEPILNSELERESQSKSDHCDIVDSTGRKYKIDFKSMQEYSLDENGQRRGHALKIRRYDSTKEGEKLPKRWDRMDDNLKLVTLQTGSPEYKQAEKRFIDGGANLPIKKIERIQNKSLYQLYKAKKREMDKRNGNHENEKRLFHGTDVPTVTQINENGFNRSYCGKNATAYGNGVYFAVNSSYSVNYAKASPQGERKMYIVRVLTGISTPSSAGMNVLPLQPGKNYPYDSGSARDIFIIFHDAQTYPEYLITF